MFPVDFWSQWLKIQFLDKPKYMKSDEFRPKGATLRTNCFSLSLFVIDLLIRVYSKVVYIVQIYFLAKIIG